MQTVFFFFQTIPNICNIAFVEHIEVYSAVLVTVCLQKVNTPKGLSDVLIVYGGVTQTFHYQWLCLNTWPLCYSWINTKYLDFDFFQTYSSSSLLTYKMLETLYKISNLS